MGPPATRRRLCVLLQIGDQLVPGLEEFLFVDDVVAIEDGAALVAGQEHGDPLEVVLGCEILNRLTEFGRPVSYRIGR